MPSKKKNAPNAFMIFTHEWKAKYGQRMNLNDAVTAAGKVWAGMSPQERGPYQSKAKNEKLGMMHKAEKLTCTGKPLSLVIKEREEAERLERQIKRNIETTVHSSLQNGELVHQSYFFIMANYFAKTIKENVYIPAEISVCEYSLKQGVSRVYHTLVNPGVNIYGHLYEAQHHSETTHNLPLPPKAMGESCLARIYNDIIDFVRNKETGKCPPVYTLRDSIGIVDSVLDFLMVEPDATNVKLDIYPIQYLFFILKEVTCEVGEVEKPKSFFITDAFFERDHFEYTVGCKYHDDLDRNRYCTKSYVTRWGYVFSDYMCSDLAIKLIPERHVPKGINLNENVLEASNNDDTDSIISMMTDTSVRTQALSEHRIYHDHPKWPCSEPSTSTFRQSVQRSNFSDIDGDEFPSLAKSGQNNRKKVPYSSTTPVPKATKINPIGDYMDSDESEQNPWATRSRNVPPKPADTSVFDVNIKLEESAEEEGTECYSAKVGFGRGHNRSLDASHISRGGRGRMFRP